MLISDISDEFFSDEVAIEAEFTPQNGSPSTVLIIFDRNYIEAQQFGDVKVEQKELMATVKTSDFINAKQGDQLSIDGVDYFIINAQVNPEDAISVMKLSKSRP